MLSLCFLSSGALLILLTPALPTTSTVVVKPVGDSSLRSADLLIWRQRFVRPQCFSYLRPRTPPASLDRLLLLVKITVCASMTSGDMVLMSTEKQYLDDINIESVINSY